MYVHLVRFNSEVFNVLIQRFFYNDQVAKCIISASILVGILVEMNTGRDYITHAARIYWN